MDGQREREGGRRRRKLLGALDKSNYKENWTPNKREEARGIMESYIGGGKWEEDD